MTQSKEAAAKSDLIHGNTYAIPTRRCLPEGLYQCYVEANHLDHLASNTSFIQGSGIGFSPIAAKNSAIGEWVERYAASHQNKADLLMASEVELKHKNIPHLPLELFIPFHKDQYKPNFPYRIISEDDKISWVKCKNILGDKLIWIPAFAVYLPHDTSFDENKQFTLQTSTGISAGRNMEEALVGGFLECAERHAFSEFWYRQNHWIHHIPRLNQEAVLQIFSHEKIQHLFGNKRVHITLFDLSPLSPIETHLVILYFPYKGKLFQSMGCATRFSKDESIIKACLEAYQGVEYAIGLSQKPENWIQDNDDCRGIDSFDKHFAFYNKFPEWRKKSVVLQAAINKESFIPTINNRAKSIQSWQEISQLDLRYILAVPLSTEDVQSQGFEVVRVIVPEWNLLTGIHSQPFLKNLNVTSGETLFTQYPHPFP